MKISGFIKMISNPTSGTSKAGKEWSKQEFVVSLDGGGNYPDEMVIAAFGDEKIAIVQSMAVGQHVDLLVDARAQEFNGRYYNSINLYRMAESGQAQADKPATTYEAPADYGKAVASTLDFDQPQEDGLPF